MLSQPTEMTPVHRSQTPKLLTPRRRAFAATRPIRRYRIGALSIAAGLITALAASGQASATGAGYRHADRREENAMRATRLGFPFRAQKGGSWQYIISTPNPRFGARCEIGPLSIEVIVYRRPSPRSVAFRFLTSGSAGVGAEPAVSAVFRDCESWAAGVRRYS